jgi:hypothetical protein
MTIINSTKLDYRNGVYSYVKNADRIEQENGTCIKAKNEYTDEQEAERSIVIAKKCAAEVNDLQHCADPGAALYSRYDVSDTAQEGHIWNLWNLVTYGHFFNCADVDDALADGLPNYSSRVDEAEEKRYQRQMVNKQIGNILQANHISLSADDNVTFSVNMSNHIRVSGVDDDTAKKLEDALNQGDNGDQLARHIILSKHSIFMSNEERTDTEWKSIDKYKFSEAMREYTGYGLDECTQDKTGNYILPDGKNAWSCFKSTTEAAFDGDMAGNDNYWHQYESFYKSLVADRDSEHPDMNISIAYHNGSLYDLGNGKQYGDGETGWIDKIVEQQEKVTKKPESAKKYSEEQRNYFEAILLEKARSMGGKWLVDAVKNGQYDGMDDSVAQKLMQKGKDAVKAMGETGKSGKDDISTEISQVMQSKWDDFWGSLTGQQQNKLVKSLHQEMLLAMMSDLTHSGRNNRQITAEKAIFLRFSLHSDTTMLFRFMHDTRSDKAGDASIGKLNIEV